MRRELEEAIAAAAAAAATAKLTELRALALIAHGTVREDQGPAAKDAQYLDAAELAKRLGVSRATLGRQRRDPSFPRHVVGRRERFLLGEVRSFLDARGERPPTPKSDIDVDVAGALAAGGLRVVGGGRR